MKKITFILFALIAGTTFAQTTASADAVVKAEIVSPISIDNVSALNFGRIIGGTAGGGLVTVDADVTGARSGAVALIVPGGTVNSAEFTVNASTEYLYKITIPTTDLTAASSSETMSVVYSSSLGFTNISGLGSAQTLYVGGVLTVGANQSEDIYSGTATVTVAYE